MLRDFAERYLQALEGDDPAAALALFADGASVVSPLYGTADAAEFIPAM